MKYILRVDDDPSIVRAFARQYAAKVKAAGATLLEAMHPTEALRETYDTVRAGDAILAVLDFNLPVINGLELLARLRSYLGRGVEVKAVFYSGDVTGVNQRAIEGEGEIFLAKPHDDGKLGSIVMEFLEATLPVETAPAVEKGG